MRLQVGPYDMTGIHTGRGDWNTDMQRNDCVKVQEKVAFCESKRAASDEINPLDILIFDFWPPELQENTFLLVQSPSLWYFLMAANKLIPQLTFKTVL